MLQIRLQHMSLCAQYYEEGKRYENSLKLAIAHLHWLFDDTFDVKE